MFTSLHHLIDLEWMIEAFRLTRKDGAPGIDGVTADGLRGEPGGQSHGPPGAPQIGPLCRAAGAAALHPEGGRDEAPARHPDAGRQGCAAGDPAAARADLRNGRSCLARSASGPAARPMTPFAPCASGFMEQGLRWVVDVDISKYFDTIDHAQLRQIPRPASDGRRRPKDDRQMAEGGGARKGRPHAARLAERPKAA